MTAPGHAGSLLASDSEHEEEVKKQLEDELNDRLKEESSAFYASGQLWDDGVVLPQDTRKVKTAWRDLNQYNPEVYMPTSPV